MLRGSFLDAKNKEAEWERSKFKLTKKQKKLSELPELPKLAELPRLAKISEPENAGSINRAQPRGRFVFAKANRTVDGT